MISRLLRALRDLWGKMTQILRMIRPEPHGLLAGVADAREQREKAIEAADKVERRISAIRLIIEAADGAADVVHPQRNRRR
jgi:hypothetical protein